MTLKQARKRHGGFTQPELADKLGMSAQSVYLWEAGKVIPKQKRIRQIAQVLGIAADELEFAGSGR